MVRDVGRDAHTKTNEFLEKFKGGHVETKHLCCRFWTFKHKQDFLSMKLIQNLQHDYPKMRGGGVKGRLKFRKKFPFGAAIRPLVNNALRFPLSHP